MKRFLLVLSLLLAVACASAQEGETLIFGSSGLPVSLDTATDGNSLIVQQQILENLVGVKLGTAELRPELAKSWSSNEDATVWTFELQEGVTFQDGTPFNAEAVVFNVKRWNDPNHPYGYRDQGETYVAWDYIFGGFKGDENNLVEGVRAVDEYTVEFQLSRPVGFFPAMLSSSYFGLHSPTAVKEGGPAYGTPAVGAVGTGPFKFVEWVQGSKVVLERYDDYWREPAHVERLVFLGIEDPTIRLAQLQAGAIDIAANLAPDDLTVVQENPNLKVARADANLNIGFLGIQQSYEPLGKVKVRKAIAHAIDKQAIVDAFYAGAGVPASQFIPPGLFGRAAIESYPYNPEKAKQLLAEAGYPDGFETQLWYMPVSRPYFPDPQPIATALAAYLADVGIEAELRTEDWGTYLEDYRTGEFPLYMIGWSADFADPDNFVYTFFGPAQVEGRWGWKDPEAIELLNQARQATEKADREALYQEFNQLIHEQAIGIPIAHNRVLHATRANIEGFMPGPLGAVMTLRTVTKE